MYEINAIGQACPMPVILTKRALKEYPGQTIKISVDNEIATQNLSKMAEQLGMSVKIEETTEAAYTVYLFQNSTVEGNGMNRKAPEAAASSVASDGRIPYLVALHSDTIGQGSEELGRTLMRSFLFSLTEQEHLPEKILFYNGGAKLTAEGSPVLEDLKALEAEGVEILTCGICVEYYDFKDKLMVGAATNMYRIVELQSTYKTVCP